MGPRAAPLRDLVLVGGGHTHIEVIRRWGMTPLPGVRLTVVLDGPTSVYSGMVPGFVAGAYTAADLEIDVWALCRRARVRVLGAAAIGLDPGRGMVRLEGRPPVAYDVVSFDVGSTVAGASVPGVRAHALATRPIGAFAARIDEAVRPGARILVVGGGAGGVELAFTLQRRTGGPTTLVDAGDRVLTGYPARLAGRVEAAAARRGITLRCGVRVTSVDAQRTQLSNGEALPFDLLVWVTGAAPNPLLASCELPTDAGGYLKVGPTLQVEGHPSVFAAGDCAALAPPIAKAGVYAVREGPYLWENLRAQLTGAPLRPYVPQRDFLTLLNLGDGTALGTKWGVTFEGAWVWRWKDRIDRAFMQRYRGMSSAEMPDDGMVCGGCAAKVGQSDLTRALSRLGTTEDPTVETGLTHPDDAAVFVTPRGERIGATIDAFTAFMDDPYIVGRIAAANAVNDLYAKGITPRWALALVGIPTEERAEEALFQVMSGARATLDPLGITIVGGHTIRTAELQVGFAMNGIAEGPIRPLGGLREGDQLVLTRALGTGVLFRADAMGRAQGIWVLGALAEMARPHRDADRIARQFEAGAATDVTGFGLAGHLGEMLQAANLSATVSLSRLPLLPGVRELLARGVRSTFHAQNTSARRFVHGPEDPLAEILYDPQTAGGLLFGVKDGQGAVDALRAAGDSDAAVIGAVGPQGAVPIQLTP